jgi:hypothetical protein
MTTDPVLRTLYRLAQRVDGDDFVRVRQALAERRSELALADSGDHPFVSMVGRPREPETASWEPGFRPLDRDEAPRLARRPGETRNRIVPRDWS